MVIKFKQFIAEAFDKPYRYRMHKDQYGWTARFETDNDEPVDVHIKDDEDSGDWDIDFYRNGSLDVTGEGDAMRIFATVMEVIKEFIAKEKPERFQFSAVKADVEYNKGDKTGSREKLYSRMIKKYVKGYNVKTYKSSGGSTYFFEKK